MPLAEAFDRGLRNPGHHEAHPFPAILNKQNQRKRSAETFWPSFVPLSVRRTKGISSFSLFTEARLTSCRNIFETRHYAPFIEDSIVIHSVNYIYCMSILMGLDTCQRRLLQLTTAFLLLLTAEAFSPPTTPTQLTSLLASVFNSEDDSTNELYQPSAGKNFVEEEVDIAIVGAGIGGLCAGAILNTLHGKKVGIYER